MNKKYKNIVKNFKKVILVRVKKNINSQRTINFLEKESSLLLIIGILILIGIILWSISQSTKDFGLNFLTEMLGVLVTVLIIDKVIKIREKNRLIPKKIVVYEDIRLFVSRYISFWTTTYRDSVPQNEPNTLIEFFSDNGMPKILDYLYMDSEPNVTPPTKWWDWIVINSKEFNKTGDKILDRHSHILEPEVYAHIHQLAESNFNKFLLMIPNIKNSDIIHNFPRVKILKSYSTKPNNEDFESILYLYNWCEIQYQKFITIKPNIKRVIQYTTVQNRSMPPKCQIPESILRNQILELENFRNKNKGT